MIATLVLTDRGPAIVRRGGRARCKPARSRERRRERCRLVVVGRELYTRVPASDWPVPPASSGVLRATLRGRAVVASTTMRRIAADAGLRSTAILVPRDAVGARPVRGPLHRLRRRVDLRRCRFRTVRSAADRLKAALTLVVLLLAAGTLVAASRGVARAARELASEEQRAATARRERALGAQATAEQERLTARIDLLERRVGLSPEPLLRAIAWALGPNNRVRSLECHGDAITLVVHGRDDTDIAARLSQLAGITTVTHSTRRSRSGTIVTVDARRGRPRPTERGEGSR